jgi:hypothetical protein
MAQRLGWVACDTDPFKLHWAWSLWIEGLASRAYWDACRELSRAAFADGRRERSGTAAFDRLMAGL